MRHHRLRHAGMCLFAALLLGSGISLGLPPDDRVDFADGLLARGLHELAIREYLGFLRDHADHAQAPGVLYRLGEAYRGQGNVAAADHFYRRAIQEHPEHELRSRAEFRRAELFLEAGRGDDAARLFDELVERAPEPELQAAALYFAGQSRLRTGEVEVAEQRFRRLMNDNPEAPHAPLARLDLADLLRDSGRADEARVLYRSVAASADPALAAEAIFQQADMAFRAGHFPTAAALYETLFRDHADHPRTEESALAAAWSFLHDGRYARVLELAAEPREAEGPSQVEWLYLSANSRRLLMDTDEALAEYDRLTALDPEGPFAPSAAYEGALLALHRKAYADAVRRASSAALDGEHAADLHWILAEAYAGVGDTARALQYYRRILDRFPDHARAGDAGYRLGDMLRQRRQWPEASAAFRRFASRYPGHPRVPAAWLASGHAQANEGHWEEAVADWTRLIEMSPEHALVEEALFRRALAEVRLERDEDALESLRALRLAYPASRFRIEAGYWMGVLYGRIGEPEEAEKELRRALEADPPPEWDRRLRHALAGVLQRAGRLAESADYLQGLLGTPMEAELTPALLDWLARLRLETGDPKAAAAAASALMKHAALQPGQRERAGLLLGRAHAEAGEVEAAVEMLTTALASAAQDDEALDARLLLGRLHADQSRWPDAEEAFRTVVAHASATDQTSAHAAGLFGLGDAAERSGDLEAAARFFLGTAILFDDPEQSPHALYRAVRGFEALDRPEEAAAARQELADRYPDSPWRFRLDETPVDKSP